jgi:hypothetical protein
MKLVYDNAIFLQASGQLDWDSSTFKVLLLKTGYTPSKDHDYVSQLTPASNEISVSGYARQTLANSQVLIDGTNHVIRLKTDNVTFSGLSAGQTAVAFAIFKQGTNDADSPLVYYSDEDGFPLTTDTGEIFIQWSEDGIIVIQQV